MDRKEAHFPAGEGALFLCKEGKMGKIAITYHVVTEESAEHGDFAEKGWVDEQGQEYSMKKAVEFLTADKFVTPSSSFSHDGVWFTDMDGELDFRTGARTYYSYFLHGFSQKQCKAIFRVISRRT